jgi:hypothetical protein
VTRPPAAKPFRLFSLVALLAAAVPALALAGSVTQLTTNSTEDLNTDAAVDVTGTVHVVYERDSNVYYRARTGTTWSAEELVAAGTNPAVGAGASGVPQVAFLFGGATVMFTARAGGAWATPVPIAPGSYVDMAVDAGDVAHVIYLNDTYGDGYRDINYANNSGGSFPSGPIKVWNSWYYYDGWGRSANYYFDFNPIVAVDSAGHYAIAYSFRWISGGGGWNDWGTSVHVYKSDGDVDFSNADLYKGYYPAPGRNGLTLAESGTAYLAFGTTLATVAASWAESSLPAGSGHTLDASPAPALHLGFVDTNGTPEYAVDTGSGFETPVIVGPTTWARSALVIARTDPFVVYEARDSGNYEVYFARTTNQAPVFDAIGDKTVNEGETLSFTVHATDADGDELQYGGSGMPSNTTLDPYTGEFTFSPDFTQHGSYTNVTFQVSDGEATDEKTITITVNDVNAAPVLAAIGNRSVDENSELSFTLSATDADLNGLTFSASNLPAGATLDPSTGAFSWTPTYSQSGTYPGVVFTVTDDGTPNLSDSETITITVTNVNREPYVAPIPDKSVDEGQTLTFTVSATDPDEDTLTYSASNLPKGAAFDPATRTFSWTPDYEKAGSYSVEFTATDDGTPPLSNAQSVAITVHDVNAPPILDPIGDRSVSEGGTLTFTVSGTAEPDFKDTLTFSASGLPNGASFDPATRTFSWTPDYSQAGAHTGIVFTVTDDGEPPESDSETITITVDNVNRAPVLGAIGDKAVDEGHALSFTLSASDEDAEALTYGASNLPSGATLNPTTGAFSWTPTYSQSGDYAAVVFTVFDGHDSDSETITITVNDDPTPPGFFTVTPCRLIDTRAVEGERGGPALMAGATRTFDVVAGSCSIPASARAISVNVTVTQATAAGYLQLFPAGGGTPTVSTINYSAGRTRGNNAIVRLGDLGQLAVRCGQAAGTTAHFILDVNGYFQEETIEQ